MKNHLEKFQVEIIVELVPERGLEPPRPCEHMVLNHACLPFHHSGMCSVSEAGCYLTRG